MRTAFFMSALVIVDAITTDYDPSEGSIDILFYATLLFFLMDVIELVKLKKD